MKYKNQIDYWNNATDKKFTTVLNLDLMSKYVDKNSLIVDYGCGYGRILNDLYQKGYKNLIGFDYSPAMIERGEREYPFLDLRVSKNNSIDLPSNSADMVMLFAVLTCIIDDNSQRALIKEIRRVLKPDEIVYINDFLINTDERNIKRYEEYQKKYGNYGVFELDEGAVLRHHSEKHIGNLTKIFKTEIFKKTIFKTMNGHRSNGFYFIGRK